VDGEYVPRPEVVRIFIGGLFGPSFEVFSDGVTVRYKRAEGMYALETTSGVTFTPDLKQWKQFRQDLDQLDAWKWQARYVNEGVMDGTKWYATIADGPNRIISSSGSNAYPEGFDGFLAAVRRLIGDREFK
jgi:hypothetical protein